MTIHGVPASKVHLGPPWTPQPQQKSAGFDKSAVVVNSAAVGWSGTSKGEVDAERKFVPRSNEILKEKNTFSRIFCKQLFP